MSTQNIFNYVHDYKTTTYFSDGWGKKVCYIHIYIYIYLITEITACICTWYRAYRWWKTDCQLSFSVLSNLSQVL